MTLTRRRFLTNTAAAGAALGAGLVPACSRPPGMGSPGSSSSAAGYGGATCAKYIRYFDPEVNVTLVEMRARYHTCPFSNTVLGGLRRISSTAVDYTGLKNDYGVDVVHAEARTIDPEKRVVTLADGSTLPYQRLVVSRGSVFSGITFSPATMKLPVRSCPMPGMAWNSLRC